MKMIKKRVLTLLLLTFAFFVMHDYVIADVHNDAKYELSYKICDKAEMQHTVHDAIHNIFNFDPQESLFVEKKLLDTPPSSCILRLSSYITPVKQKPPLL